MANGLVIAGLVLAVLLAALLPLWVWLGHPRDWPDNLPSLRRFGRSLRATPRLPAPDALGWVASAAPARKAQTGT